MKPRFSILALLLITAFVAVNTAGLMYGGALWRVAVTFCTFGMIYYAMVLTARRPVAQLLILFAGVSYLVAIEMAYSNLVIVLVLQTLLASVTLLAIHVKEQRAMRENIKR